MDIATSIELELAMRMYIKLHNLLHLYVVGFMTNIAVYLAGAIQGWPLYVNIAARLKYVCTYCSYN